MALTRPLALSLTGLGLAGLLLTAMPPLSLGSQAAAPEMNAAAIAAGSGASPAASPAPASAPGDLAGRPDPVDTSTTPDGSTRVAQWPLGEPRPLLPLSVALLGIGAALFTLRRIAVALRPVR